MNRTTLPLNLKRRMHIVLILLAFFSPGAFATESKCFGTTSNGRLENGVKLPAKGDNFVSYSSAAAIAGRTYVHSKVKSIIVSAYKSLEKEQSNKVFKYAETGFKQGGKFKPHKTHQNGLSVDFMVPVLNKSGQSVHLPTNLFNKLGYKIEFDQNSEFGEYTIDYEALAAHVVALHRSSKAAGSGLWRVIFDPQLQANLFATKYGPYLKRNVQFSEKRSWVRHDEHYHVDFDIACE